ncbi:hypothetical protein [Lachnoanaerobaculum sp. OBRC5-5]|uniref:hypothetical protein n=1 Tax=Lachnoanaerobaculum sp. OBRC5-5 TaxID=936595 RepID=UPI0002824D42|nr:hypothetical protein [Lachnoanaerobaculum sp. OBRC5-5]EJZ69236.1 hypothetical protein HMPREF1135_02460 [Lachnoanaerobaculum sp. OBRC5-5]
MKKKVKNNIRSILLKILIIIASISAIIFIRDVLVKRGVSIVMFTRKDYMNAAEYYMQQKYGEKFESEYIYDGSVYVHPKSNPYRHVVVDVENKDGMTYFHDNYVGYLKKAELEKYIYELAKPIYGECKVYIHPYGFSLDDSFNKDTDLMTYVSNGNYALDIFTYENAENMETELNKTCSIFIENKLECNVINVTYITQENFSSLEEINIDNIYNSKDYYYSLDSIYDKKNDTGFSDIDVLKGRDGYGK